MSCQLLWLQSGRVAVLLDCQRFKGLCYQPTIQSLLTCEADLQYHRQLALTQCNALMF
jgi:hypothetical protein